MLDADVRITHQHGDGKWIDGKPVRQVRIEFMVGEDGPFSVRLDEAGFTAAVRDDCLNAMARELRRS